MISSFKGDYRILRVVLESKDPITTLQNFRMGHYSIITLLDMIEMLDVRDTIKEDQLETEKIKNDLNNRKGRV